MQFEMVVDMENDIFVSAPITQLAKLLLETRRKLEAGHMEGVLHDVSGNRVGSFRFTGPLPTKRGNNGHTE